VKVIKNEKVINIDDFSLFSAEKELVIVFDSDNYPLISLDFIPKNREVLIQKIKNKKKSSLDEQIEKILESSSFWDKIDNFLTLVSDLIHDDDE